MDEQELQRLIFDLRFGDVYQRRAAAYKLIKSNDSRAVPILTHAYNDDDSIVQKNAIDALRKNDSQEAIDFLNSHNIPRIQENNRMPVTSHLILYIALYFGGASVGAQGGWIFAVLLTELKIIYPPWHIPIILIVAIIGAYIPKNLFANKVAAICPSCGGKAFLKWASKPLRYVCTDCGYIHKTSFSLRGK